MQKSDIVNLVAARTEMRRTDISMVLDTALELIIREVANGKRVSFLGFGSFEARSRAARRGPNPYNGEMYETPPKKVPFFFASKGFKQAVWSEEDGKGLV
jgi:DNA-binding protein HU-beta